MSNKIELKIAGVKYSGWTTVRVEKSMDVLSGAMEAEVTQDTPFNSGTFKIRMGDVYEVLFNGISISKGFIEDINMSYSASSHDVVLGGREIVCDLVDCSRVDKLNGRQKKLSVADLIGGSNEIKREWIGLTVLELVTVLVEPFEAVLVVVDPTVETEVQKKITRFGVNEGETVFETLIRLLNQHAIRPISLGDGKLTLTRVGSSRTSDRLETGLNLLSGASEQSDKNRFSNYIAKAQASGADTLQLGDFTSPVETVTDKVVRRYRPLIILAEKESNTSTLKDRATWEASLRAGNSRTLNYSVQSWLQSNNSAWPLNSLIQVKDTVFNVDDTFLICTLAFVHDNEGGTKTILGLCSPEKYKAEANIDKIKSELDDAGEDSDIFRNLLKAVQ